MQKERSIYDNEKYTLLSRVGGGYCIRPDKIPPCNHDVGDINTCGAGCHNMGIIMSRVLDGIHGKARRHYPKNTSHGWNHIRDVLRRARKYKGSPLSHEEYAAIVYHDSSVHGGSRKTHHMDSANILRKDLRNILSKVQISRASKAIEEHRASYSGKFSSSLSELLSSADRDIPNVEDVLERAIQYRRERGYNDEDARRDAVAHVKEKYGRNGYQRLPDTFVINNKDILNRFWDEVDRL